jgi:hypothetical protein
MATSVYAFRGIPQISSDLKIATLEIPFDPPSNIAGKNCYVECSAFAFDFGTTPAGGLTSRDVITFTASWSQVCSGTVSDDKAISSTDTMPSGVTRHGRVPMAMLMNNTCYPAGPVLCQIPRGPHTVTFTIFRPDGDTIAAGSLNLFFALFKFCDTKSRPPLIGG